MLKTAPTNWSGGYVGYQFVGERKDRYFDSWIQTEIWIPEKILNFSLTIEGRDSPLLNDPCDRMCTRSETVLYGVASCIQEVKKQVTDRGFTKCNETSQTWIPTSPRLTHSPRLPSDKRLHLVGSSSRLLITNIYIIYTSLCILIVIWVRHKSWQ